MAKDPVACLCGSFQARKERPDMSSGDWKDFYQAAVQGDLPVVAHHLAEGVDPDYQHPEIMRSALVASLIEGHLEVSRLLIEQGAHPSLVSYMDGVTPLEAALANGHHELARVLRQSGATDIARPIWARWLKAWRMI